MQVHPIEEVLLVVTDTGTVHWVPPVHTQTSCPALLEVTYPYDTVTCMVVIGSWMHDGWEVDFAHIDHIFLYNFVNINPR